MKPQDGIESVREYYRRVNDGPLSAHYRAQAEAARRNRQLRERCYAAAFVAASFLACSVAFFHDHSAPVVQPLRSETVVSPTPQSPAESTHVATGDVAEGRAPLPGSIYPSPAPPGVRLERKGGTNYAKALNRRELACIQLYYRQHGCRKR
jgi:hypothetical protein